MKLFFEKYKKKAGILLLTFFVAAQVFSGTAGEAAASSKSKTSLSDLEEQRKETLEEIDSLKNSISDVKDEIKDLKTEKTTIQSAIRKLDEKSDAIAGQITSFEKKIDAKIADIEVTKQELEEAKKECDEQYASMKKRIQYIYERSSKSLVELLVTSENLSEALNRVDFVFQMADYEDQMMKKLTAIKDEVALKEQTLQAEHEELEMMKEALEQEKKQVTLSINNKKSELSSKNSEISDANSEQKDYEQQLKKQEKLLDEIEEQIAKAAQPDVYDGEVTGFIWPCPSYTRISSYFGPRPQPVPGASTNHKGIDLAAPYGANILASASGKVTTSKYSASAGNYIVIAHGNGISTVYMHCSSLLVSVGETVSQGQVIAKVGSTGYSSGNHLHFGVIKNGTYVNPLNYVSP